MLNTLRHGTDTGMPPLVIVHGLFGSARNWGVIAKRLSDTRLVVTVDQRNHGESPRFDSNTYADMANDLAELIATLPGPVDLVGHSMGGKASMLTALTHPDLIGRMVVADIAPVTYSHSQLPFIEKMRAVDLSRVTRRSEAAEQLAELGVEPALQSFFTQSLDVANKQWKLNLDALEANMPAIMSFPDTSASWEGPVLFLSGGASDYVLPQHRDKIRSLFPSARFAKIPGAGHWLHAEKPREFEAALRVFLD